MMRRAILLAMLLVASVPAALMAFTDPDPLDPSRVRHLARQLNEAAAVAVPHFYLMDAGRRAEHLDLLTRVERGEPIDAASGIVYRRLIQDTLRENQAFLSRFDGELAVLADHAMHRGNNAGGHGIAGWHDHHDQSARANFASLLSELAALKRASGWLGTPGRIVSAAQAQKDLVDIIGHLAISVHTVSVPYEPQPAPWPDDELGPLFEATLAAFKTAQAEPVNSPPYRRAVDAALETYATMVLLVQDRIVVRTSRWERRLSGRFLSPQTLAPPVDLDRPPRPRPAP